MSGSEKKLPAELEKQLMELGLTNYQARVYRAAFILKACSISQIANFSKVPTAKVYSVVSDLKGMGMLAEIPKSRPVMFKPFPPDQYIAKEKNRIVEIGEQIKESLAALEAFRKEKGPTEDHETLLIENELLVKNLILDALSPPPADVLFVIQGDFDFYEEVLSRLVRQLKAHGGSKITVTLIDPHNRKLEFLQRFSELNFHILNQDQIQPALTEILKKFPILFVIDEKSFLNITQTEQTLEYLYLKSKTFADFIKTSIRNVQIQT